MRSQYSNATWQMTSPTWVRFLKRNIPLLLFLVLSTIGMGTVYWFFSPISSDAQTIMVTSLEGSLSAPIFKAVPAKPVSQRLAQSPGPVRIGLIAGHQGSDSGSVCDDGLTEAEVNENIASKVFADLQRRGIRTELLQEFDPRLDGYSATALVSIHADSCTYVNELATGFKPVAIPASCPFVSRKTMLR
jgi:N-acetylmuramoyl-L-alanine amidase